MQYDQWEQYPVSVEVDLTSPPLVVPLRAVVRQVPDVVNVTVRLLRVHLQRLYPSQGLNMLSSE